MIGILNKFVGHMKRLATPTARHPEPDLAVGIPVVKRKVDKASGKVVTYVEFEIDDKASRLSQYRVNDFALENLIAADVPLDPSILSASGISVADRVSDGVAKLSVEYPKTDLSDGENS